jgi:TonB family protein
LRDFHAPYFFELSAGRFIAARWSGFALSLCLHGLVVLAVFFAPRPEIARMNLDLSALNLIQVTIGASLPSQPEAETPAPATEPAPPPAPPAAEPAVPVPRLEELTPAPEPDAPPASKPEAVPEPRPTPRPSDEDILREAFADARREAKPASRADGGRTVADNALSDALSDARKRAGPVVSGAAGDGIGYYGTYLDSVISRVRRHFVTRPRSDGKIFEMTVFMEITDDGTVKTVRVLKSSGDGIFDGNVLRAIHQAGKMEPPRRKDVRRLEIVFNSQLMGTR